MSFSIEDDLDEVKDRVRILENQVNELMGIVDDLNNQLSPEPTTEELKNIASQTTSETLKKNR